MSLFDLPLDRLWERRIETPEPDDLDGWWAARLAEARDLAKPPTLTPYRPDAYGPLPVYDVEFSGARGDGVRGWYLRPPGSDGARLPVVVTFIGYGGGRGLPSDHATPPAVGFAHFVIRSPTRTRTGRSRSSSRTTSTWCRSRSTRCGTSTARCWPAA
jgi:cephalosporin-C deacetylase